MSEHKTFSVAEAVKAQSALREAAGLQPEQFPVEAFVGMISDEIEALRKQGHSDAEIAALVSKNSHIDLSAEEIAANYAPAELRHGGGH